MITNKETQAIELSPTKRDFYQLWNELLGTAGKLSERWDPSATNESDPGIVLLKVLTAVADKLNYAIDKSILEAFMPSATQESAMRALCEMMGYEMKYYRSAVADLTVSYSGDIATTEENFIRIPKGTYVTDTDDGMTYFTLSDVYFRDAIALKTVAAMEGQWEKCEVGSSNDEPDRITLENIDDQNRYYLPERQIAENGVFVYSYVSGVSGFVDSSADEWKRVSNVNVCQAGEKAYRFGYDSANGRPYVQFPQGLSELIGDGLRIYYVRTNGVNGNVSYGKLNKFKTIDDVVNASAETMRDAISSGALSVVNRAATSNGSNIESMNDAYLSYKRTIGTFDTLVTCRDYMNKIYELTESETDSRPLVSNIIAADIRDDINRTYPVTTLSMLGQKTVSVAAKDSEDKSRISSFDLVLYPFAQPAGQMTYKGYKNTFKYSEAKLLDIQSGITDSKTLAHNIITPEEDDVACVMNRLKIKATITTYSKVNIFEEKAILNNVYRSVYDEFNMRKLSFGEQIPTDAVLACIKAADSRIKDVYSDGPTLETSICFADGQELTVADDDASVKDEAKEAYDKLVLRNVTAGKIPLWNYDARFKANIGEKPCGIEGLDDIYGKTVEEEEGKEVSKVFGAIEATYEPELNIDETGALRNELTLTNGEVIKMRRPSLTTTKTYSAYINYYFKKDTKGQETNNVAAAMQTLSAYLSKKHAGELEHIDIADGGTANGWDALADYLISKEGATDSVVYIESTVELVLPERDVDAWPIYKLIEASSASSEETADEDAEAGEGAEDAAGEKYRRLEQDEYDAIRGGESFTKLAYVKFKSADDFASINRWVREQTFSWKDESGEDRIDRYSGLYVRLRVDLSREPGKLVDANNWVYREETTASGELITESAGFTKYYMQSPDDSSTGLGKDAVLTTIAANADYKLTGGDALYINYTKNSTDDSGAESSTVINEKLQNVIIRPSFPLKDSASKHAFEGASYTKKTGYSFPEDLGEAQIAGMFALGANEQIELREPIVAKIGGEGEQEYANFYWMRADDADIANIGKKEIKFEFEETEGGEGKDKIERYTLKSGEYFYFTDASKLSMVYYGPGTMITKHGDWDLIKNETGTGLDAETIEAEGLAAAIPWRTHVLNDGKYLEITEYQYITLTAGDKLLGVSFSERGDNQNGSEGTVTLTGKYEKVDAARYAFDDGTGQYEGKEEYLPSVIIDGLGWEMASFLDINMSPTVAQTLGVGDKLKLLSYKVTVNDDGEYETERYEAGDKELTSTEGNALSLRSNYAATSANGRISTFIRKYNADGSVKRCDDDFAVRLFEKDAAKLDYLSDSSREIDVGNYGGLWTKVTFDDEHKKLTVPVTVPKGDFGLLTYCCEGAIEVTNVGGEITELGGSDGKTHTLGLRDAEGSRLSAITFEAEAGGRLELILGGVNLVLDEEDGFNKKLLRLFSYDGLIDKISELAGEVPFYWDAPTDSSMAMDLRAIDEDLGMRDPNAWYDANNVNNKFVISQIDADYMEDGGISIASSCRLR